MKNTTNPNHNHTYPRFQFFASFRVYSRFKFSASSVAKNIKTRSRSNTTKLCAFVPLCLCTFLPIPVNPVKILTVKISVQNSSLLRHIFQKYLVGPTNSENFPLSLFVKNMQKSTKIVKRSRQEKQANACKTCQNMVKSGPLLVKTIPLFDGNIQKSSEMFRNSPQKRS